MTFLTITVISDTHGSHAMLSQPKLLPGGDIIIHSGDISDLGKKEQVRDFCKWFNGLSQYKHKIFIAGNHDLGFEEQPKIFQGIAEEYKNIKYLKDKTVELEFENEKSAKLKVKIYGSPYQPTFFNWAFNLDRNSPELRKKWEEIPEDTDILITHGPPHGILDTNNDFPDEHLGCELLTEKIFEKFKCDQITSNDADSKGNAHENGTVISASKYVKYWKNGKIHPKIHVFGHLHEGRGYKMEKGVHFFNASILDNSYFSGYPPQTFRWDPKTNEISFIHQ